MCCRAIYRRGPMTQLFMVHSTPVRPGVSRQLFRCAAAAWEAAPSLVPGCRCDLADECTWCDAVYARRKGVKLILFKCSLHTLTAHTRCRVMITPTRMPSWTQRLKGVFKMPAFLSGARDACPIDAFSAWPGAVN